MEDKGCIVRRATAEDAKRVFEIRNHLANRIFFNSTEPINWERHEKWFIDQYHDGAPNWCYVLVLSGDVIGYFRFDFDADNRKYRTSIALDPACQGKGFGSLFYRRVLSLLPSGTMVYAEVLLTNERSLKFFRKLGFHEHICTDGVSIFEYVIRSRSILLGLKLWTGNVAFFKAARTCIEDGKVDFIELYHDPDHVLHQEDGKALFGLPITIHAPNSHGFHEFLFGSEQLRIWNDVRHLADTFMSDVIVLHPGRDHTVDTFFNQLALVDDQRIHIENMAGLDLTGKKMFGQDVDDLAKIALRKPICFDFEKATKAAAQQGIDSRTYIADALERLMPQYFHVSGGDSNNPMDQHLDLWEGSIDILFVRDTLEKLAERIGKSVRLVFETPKSSNGLENDLKNMAYFQSRM
ncbi:GNAT family N-acetyltransferase, partial [Patescibacteria group bacterium]|nr:GNAT family N-acetyltransferase [Patescibacteria group bacterium]